MYFVYGFIDSSKEFVLEIYSLLAIWSHKNKSSVVSFKDNNLKNLFIAL